MDPDANDWVLGILIFLAVIVLGGGISDFFNWIERWPGWLKLTLYYIRWPVYIALLIFMLWPF